MKMHHAVVLGMLLVLVSIMCGAGGDVRGENKSHPGTNVKNPGNGEVGNVGKEKPGEIVKKLSPAVKGDIVVEVEGGLQNGTDTSEHSLTKKKGDDLQKSSDGKIQGTESEQKEKMDGGASETSKTDSKKEKPQGEECDMSNRCMDEGKILVACLRVPGNDARGLSLLIQNKGKGTMVVKISVPSFVEVERTNVELKEKENQKVKVSFKKGGKDGDIVLSTGARSCNLNLKILIANINGGEEDTTSPKSKYLIILTENKSLSFMGIGLMVMIASLGVWLILRKRRRLATSSKYQKLDTELPISIGREETINTSDVHDGWDNGWDDNWDDEEAPMSPLPVTPSLSSKGLASRKLNKD